MPHLPKPFFRQDRGLGCVQLHGKQHNLVRDQDAAFRKYHELTRAPAKAGEDSLTAIDRAVFASRVSPALN